MPNKNRYEIIIYGRGGQGAKTTAEMIVQAAVWEGKFVQAFPEFGPERSGAPTRSFVRISNRPIRTREPIVNPNCVLVLDETLLATEKITENLTKREPLIINSKKSNKKLSEKIKKFKGKLITIDASGLSEKIIGENRPNTVMLGKFVSTTKKIKLKNIIKVFREKYQAKLGREKTDKNIQAIKKAYQSVS